MRIPLQESEGRKLFFTAGNFPTQVAYGLGKNDVLDAFIVASLLGEHLLLAASYYFESRETRALVEHFPGLWNSQDSRAMFYINSHYPTFTEHGLGKVQKSPATFKAYADVGTVKQRGAELDRLGFVAVREDVDITDLLRGMWIRSCASAEAGSIGALLSRGVSAEAADRAVAACIHLAEKRPYDFVWPAIEAQVDAHPFLRRVKPELQRHHADMYGQAMSVVLDAIETTPSCARFGGVVSQRSIGHLGLFATVLRRVGIEPSRLREEALLLKTLDYEPLSLLRDLHTDIVGAAVRSQENVNDYWRAIGLFERGGSRVTLTDLEIRRALMDAFEAAGVTADSSTVQRILALERCYAGGFLVEFRAGLEAALERRGPEGVAAPIPSARKVLLFTWADPLVPNRGIGADREYKAVRASIDGLREKSSLRVELEPALTLDRIPAIMVEFKPTFLHFSGHGSRTGEILLEPGSSAELLSIADMLAALPRFADGLECVVFSACHSITAAVSVEGSIRYVVLMSTTLDELDAMAFATAFYLKIALEMDVPAAFEAGIGGLRLRGLDTSLPRLYEWGRPSQSNGSEAPGA